MTYKAFKFRLSPTKAQIEQLFQIAGSCRFVFNHFLAIQKELYTQRKETNNPDIKFLNYSQTSAALTILKQEEATSWLQTPPSHTLQQSLMNLDKAIKGWLIKKSGFPKFKKRSNNQDSFRLPDPPTIDGNLIKLPKLGWIKYRKSREITGIIKSATISRDGSHWYISILSEQQENLDQHPSSSCLGIDVGVKHFLTLSTGEHIDLPLSINTLIARTISLQQKLSHKQKGSNNRKKAKQRLTTAYRRVCNARHDFLHKTSTTIAKNHSTVVMEDLKVSNMMGSARGSKDKPGRNVKAKNGLNRSIAKQSWVTFRNFLTYKLHELNGELLLVDPRHTSQTCPACLTIDRRNRKSQSKFVCVKCGHTANADHNAAVNILSLGILGRSVC